MNLGLFTVAPRATFSIGRLLCAAVATAIVIAVVFRAWVGDDSLITMRSVDNLVHGYGWRWNVSERVQVFTDPLWALLLAFTCLLQIPWYQALLALSFVCTGATLALIIAKGRSVPASFAALSVLLCSRAFIDFSTSGLETPLTGLLLTALVFAIPREPGAPRGALLRVALLSALLAVNRLDGMVIVAPALAWTLWCARTQRAPLRLLGTLLLGLSPLIAWELFAIIYYGFPFPNTAYAKLGGGLGRAAYLHMGADYFVFTFVWDRFSVLICVAAAVFAARFRASRATLALLAGVVLHFVYVFWAGGDFMAGRFFFAPVVLCAALLASEHVRVPAAGERYGAIVAALALFNLLAYVPLALAAPTTDGIIDERSVWVEQLGLRSVLRNGGVEHRWLHRGQAANRRAHGGKRHRQASLTIQHARSVGMVGFAAGPAVHVVDHLALADPLLARLPAAWNEHPHIGHLERMGNLCSPIKAMLAGPPESEVARFWHEYEESLRTGRCALEDDQLCRYWDSLKRVTQGKLFSRSRWRAIIALNLGRLDGLIDTERYRNATRSYPGGACDI